MKFSTLVLDDKLVHREANGEYKASNVRNLIVVDQDDAPLESMVTVQISEEDPAAPYSKGANLKRQFVVLEITRLSQGAKSKVITFHGRVLSIDGVMKREEFPAGKKAA